MYFFDGVTFKRLLPYLDPPVQPMQNTNDPRLSYTEMSIFVLVPPITFPSVCTEGPVLTMPPYSSLPTKKSIHVFRFVEILLTRSPLSKSCRSRSGD